MRLANSAALDTSVKLPRPEGEGLLGQNGRAWARLPAGGGVKAKSVTRVHLTELGKEKRDGGAHRVRVERDDCSGRFATRPSDLRQDVTSAFRIPSCGSR